jgi:vacuolar-type H+-ATPase subunit F/Vma7
MTMSRMTAIGEPALIQGYGLAGVDIVPAESPAAVRAAWRALDADVAAVILTPAAAVVVAAGQRTGDLDHGRLIAVLPASAEDGEP